MGQGHAQALAPGQVVHVQGQDQSLDSGQSHDRDQGHVSGLHRAQSHHSPQNKHLLGGGEMACVEESAILPMTGAERVTADSGVPLTGTPIPHLRDIGIPTEEGLDPTVLQAVGREITTAPTEVVAEAEEETIATITAVTLLHPVGEALGERLSETMNERETGTVLTEMLPSEMKCFGTTSTGTNETTSMDTSGTTSTETITTEKVEIGKDLHRITGTATKETTRGMAAGRAARCSNRAMATMKRGRMVVALAGSGW